jgi:Arc/MetJ-type ribon-helix-helix transcriptional regulator
MKTREEKLSTSVTDEEKLRFRRLAACNRENMSERLRKLVYEDLERHGMETSREVAEDSPAMEPERDALDTLRGVAEDSPETHPAREEKLSTSVTDEEKLRFRRLAACNGQNMSERLRKLVYADLERHGLETSREVAEDSPAMEPERHESPESET